MLQKLKIGTTTLAIALGLQYCANSCRLNSHLKELGDEFDNQTKNYRWESYTGLYGDNHERRTWNGKLDKIIKARDDFLKENNSISLCNWKTDGFFYQTINMPKNLFGSFKKVETKAIDNYFSNKEKESNQKEVYEGTPIPDTVEPNGTIIPDTGQHAMYNGTIRIN